MKTKAELIFECPVAINMQLIGNKWKLLIIRNLLMRPWRFNEMQRNLEGISQKVLTIVCGLWRRTVLLPAQFFQKFRQEWNILCRSWASQCARYWIRCRCGG